MNYNTILKIVREKYNLTQEGIADILKIDRRTYNHYETKEKIIPIKHLIVLSMYFNVSVDYLLGFTKQKQYDHVKEADKIIAGNRLKEFRKENKLTQEKLASILNTVHPVISNYENGKFLIATPFLYTICKKYNISADYLLGKIDNPKYLNS